MIRFAPCTEEIIALAKSLTDTEIDELIEQIFRNERPRSDYWEIMYVRDLWALGIEPKIASPGWKIVARFGGPFDEIPEDWEFRKSGQHIPYFGEAAEIEEYKAANQSKKEGAQTENTLAESQSHRPKAES